MSLTVIAPVDQILVILLDSRTTTNGLAEQLGLHPLAVAAIAKRHVKDGLLTKRTLMEGLDIWKLTEAGREAAEKLKPAAN